MKLKDLLKDAQENPALLEYNLCLSHYFTIKDDENGEDELTAIVDMPVIGIAINESDTEIRFIIQGGEGERPTQEEVQNSNSKVLMPVEDMTPLDTLCSVCGKPQFRCPSGTSCPEGHGGADGVPKT